MKLLLLSILIPIILSIIINRITYMIGWKYKLTKKNLFIPPGYIIAIIWMIILGLLGYVHYLLYSLNNKVSIASLFTIFVIFFCLSYPFIVKLNEKNSLLLNLITLIISFILGILVIIQSKYIFIYLIPLILWACYINIIFTIECSKIYL